MNMGGHFGLLGGKHEEQQSLEATIAGDASLDRASKDGSASSRMVSKINVILPKPSNFYR